MTARSLPLLLALATIACAGGQRSTPPSSQRAPVPFAKIDGAPSAARFLGGDPARASAAGAGDFVVIAVEAGAPGDRISGMISIPLEACVLLIARGSPSVEDVDLFAYADDGAVLGADEATNAKASLLVCPPHPKRAYVVARVAAGHGIVAVGGQLVAPENADLVGRAVGARGRPGEATGALSAWPGLDSKLGEHRRIIGSSWKDVRRVAVPVDPRTPTRLSALVEADGCLDLLVVPSDEVSHVESRVVDSRGRIIGRAAARGRERAIIVCSPVREPITLEVRPHAGRGLVAVLISKSAPGAQKDIDARVLTFDAAPVGDLKDSRKKNATRLERAGYGAAKVLGEGDVKVGRRSSMRFELAAGCSRIDVLSGRPVQGVEALLWSDKGRLIARDRGGGHAALFACSTGGGVRLDVEALNGTGRFAVELRREREAPAVLKDHPLAASRLLGRMTTRGIIRTAKQVGAPIAVRLEPTRVHRADVLVPVGRCVDVSLALGPGATGAEIRLVDKGTGAEIQLARGTHATSARACSIGRPRTLNASAELRVAAGTASGLFATRMLSPKR